MSISRLRVAPHSAISCLGHGALSRCILGFALCVSFAALCSGQSAGSKSTPSSTVHSKHFCSSAAGFCFNYPATWQLLGEAFGDGVVIAPQQSGERALWNVVTAAAVAPRSDAGESAGNIEQVIETAMANMRAAGRNPQTLERQQRTINGVPAEILELRYRDDETQRDWVEELAFIEGPDQDIYSLALKVKPEDISRLQPAFERMLRSWKLASAEALQTSPPASSAQHSGPATPTRNPHL
jgi:PsbP